MGKDSNVNNRLVTYFLSVTLIMLVIIFVISLMSMSRMVFSDFNPIGEHVLETQKLLEEVNTVRMAVNSSKIGLEQNAYFSLSYDGFKVDDIAYLNVNSSRTIVTMFFNAPVGSINNEIYYIRIDSTQSLRTGEVITFESDGVRLGEFISLNDEGNLLVMDSFEKKILEVRPNSVFGRVFYRKPVE